MLRSQMQLHERIGLLRPQTGHFPGCGLGAYFPLTSPTTFSTRRVRVAAAFASAT